MKAPPRQWVAFYTAILRSLRSIMLTSVSPFFLIIIVRNIIIINRIIINRIIIISISIIIIIIIIIY